MITKATETFQFDAIDDVVSDIAKGRIVIVTDDADRENEGDLVIAAEKVTPEAVNFMATHGRGLICVPISNERAEQLGLQRMVTQNREAQRTDFTVSVDAARGVTTGISAYDRATTILAISIYICIVPRSMECIISRWSKARSTRTSRRWCACTANVSRATCLDRAGAIAAINCMRRCGRFLKKEMVFWFTCGRKDEALVWRQKFTLTGCRRKDSIPSKPTRSSACLQIYEITDLARKFCSISACGSSGSSQTIPRRSSVWKATGWKWLSRCRFERRRIRTTKNISRQRK